MTRSFPMRLTTLAVFRAVVLLACAIMLAGALVSGMSMGPARIAQEASLNRPVAMLATELARVFTSAGPAQPVSALWFYLCLLVLAAILFAAAFWLRTSRHIKHRAALCAGLLAVQILIGALVESNLLYLVAAELAFVLPHRAALMWLCAQVAVFIASTLPHLLQPSLGTPACNVNGILPPSLPVMMGLYWIEAIAFQIFAFCVGYFAAAEMRSRHALAKAHAELGAAQSQLADAIRASERERIGRQLHEALGQHLTALNVQLNLAMRQVGSHVLESVRTAHEMAQQLLGEVRAVVSIEREQRIINLRHTLETLCAGIPSPRIVLSCDQELDVSSPALSHTVFRTVQEAISNAVRHSGASMLQIILSKSHDDLTISICDNGKGISAGASAHAGNGLRGIRERIEEAGGKLETANRSEGGFCMDIRLPLHGGAQ